MVVVGGGGGARVVVVDVVVVVVVVDEVVVVVDVVVEGRGVVVVVFTLTTGMAASCIATWTTGCDVTTRGEGGAEVAVVVGGLEPFVVGAAKSWGEGLKATKPAPAANVTMAVTIQVPSERRWSISSPCPVRGEIIRRPMHLLNC